MGRMGIEAMLESVDADTALQWHLQSNHYPPVPLKMLAVCKEAIKRVNAGKKTRIKLPHGVTFRGSSLVNPWDVIESLHLEAFLDDQGEF